MQYILKGYIEDIDCGTYITFKYFLHKATWAMYKRGWQTVTKYKINTFWKDILKNLIHKHVLQSLSWIFMSVQGAREK